MEGNYSSNLRDHNTHSIDVGACGNLALTVISTHSSSLLTAGRVRPAAHRNNRFRDEALLANLFAILIPREEREEHSVRRLLRGHMWWENSEVLAVSRRRSMSASRRVGQSL